MFSKIGFSFSDLWQKYFFENKFERTLCEIKIHKGSIINNKTLYFLAGFLLLFSVLTFNNIRLLDKILAL